MAESLGVADAKRRFAELIERVGNGEEFTVLRHGKPVLALVAPARAAGEAAPKPLGLLAGFGFLEGWDTIEADMAEVIASRAAQRERDVPDLSGWSG